MAKNKFTKEQIEILRLNPYTSFVSEEMIGYTKEFKEEFWKRMQAGDKTRKILTDLGYDPEMLGKSRMISVYSQVKQEAASPHGFRDRSTGKPTPESPNAGQYMGIPENLALQRMQMDLLHMRQELDFVKKILSTGQNAQKEKKKVKKEEN